MHYNELLSNSSNQKCETQNVALYFDSLQRPAVDTFQMGFKSLIVKGLKDMVTLCNC